MLEVGDGEQGWRWDGGCDGDGFREIDDEDGLDGWMMSGMGRGRVVRDGCDGVWMNGVDRVGGLCYRNRKWEGGGGAEGPGGGSEGCYTRR